MALDVLEALREDGGFEPGPVLLFHAAEWASGDRAARYRNEALAAPLDYAFPSRPESLPGAAVGGGAAPRRRRRRDSCWDTCSPASAATRKRPRRGKPPPRWTPASSTAHRALGMVHWRLFNRPAEGESRLRQAIEARSTDQTLYRDLARLLLDHGRPADAVEALGRVPAGLRRRHDVTIELARALNATGRFDETVAMLEATRINFREGDATVWQLFSRAEIALGRQALDAGDAETALDHFDRALTYPENLGVGRPHRAQEARALWFRAEALAALDRFDEAAVTLTRCAGNPPLSDEQEHFIARCAAAQ